MIDVNVNLSRWPFRRLAGDDPAELVALLRKGGITQAWAGSFDGLLHKDITSVNARLAVDCAMHSGFLVPFGSVNPQLPDWQEDLRRIHEVHRMPGIRLHPNYHGYTLKDPIAAELLAAASKRGLIVQLMLEMEDERTQHWLVRVPSVDTAPLAVLLASLPASKLMILNARRSVPALPGVYYDFALQEGPYAATRVLSTAGRDHVVFGSHAPLFYLEAAILKLKEAGLNQEQKRAILETNARRLLKR